MDIHETAIVSKGAKLGEGVSIGPFALIEEGTEIGDGTQIMSHCVIKQGTTLGSNCVIHHGAVLGGTPQDVKFAGEESYLKIGSGTVIREYVTAHRADGEQESTTIGEGCMIMANCHVAHNCKVGDGVVMANLSTLGGFVEVGERAFLGGLAAMHQFVRVGAFVMLGGGSIVLEDVPPYMMVAGGHRAPVCGLNTVGLMRAGFSQESRKALRKAYRIIYKEGRTVKESVPVLREKLGNVMEVQALIRFIESSERGITGGQ